MKENKYDDDIFFNKYKQMARSIDGLKSAGEWHAFKKILPNFKNKTVLDLGCGFGWHCQYAIEQGAERVIGVDISQKMLEQAKKTTSKRIEYHQSALEDIKFATNSFDIIISSLTFHYIKSWTQMVIKIKNFLRQNGEFIFSIEHPIFTAAGHETWFVDEKGKKLHWPVDNYFAEGLRTSNFLGEKVIKYHKTLMTYINTLIKHGFKIENIIEPKPQSHLLKTIEGMKDELRRPMMLIIKAQKINALN